MVTLDNGKLIIRGGKEILIPKESWKELTDQLHQTHLRNLARDRFFWPGMTSGLEKKYLGCEACKTDSISHHDKAHQVIPCGLPLLAVFNNQNGGGSFRSRFTTMLKEDGIKHVHTSPFNSKSNGGCERGIRSLKDCLKRDKIKKVTQQVLDELTYDINIHPQDESVGSAAERFFG